MKFFSDCKSEEERKAIYRKLAKCFHPDKSGNVELMIDLKKQYDEWKPLSNYNSHSTDGFVYGNPNNNYQFNKINRHSIIPHDHPIYQQIKDLNLKLEIANSVINSKIDVINNYYKLLQEKEFEVFNLKKLSAELSENIETLREQKEYLKNKIPKTIWEYLRKKYEK